MVKKSETRKPPLDDACVGETGRFEKRRKTGQQLVSETNNNNNRQNNNKTYKAFGRYYGSGPIGGKVKFWDPLGEPYDRKAKFTTTVTRKKPPCTNLDSVESKHVKNRRLEHSEPASVQPTEFGRSFDSKACYEKNPKVKTTFVSPKGALRNVGKQKSADLKPFENGEPKRIEPIELGGSRTCFGSRSASKVKFHVKKHKDNVQKEQARREEIKKAMLMVDREYKELSKKMKRKPNDHFQLTVDAARNVKDELRWKDAEKKLGRIRGVEVGDRFKFRSQLHMIGLHCQLQAGIDYTKSNGKNLAISIVDSHRYSNDGKYPDKLVYSGHGGNEASGSNLPPTHQKLEGGNQALMNSKDEKNPVRVIRKVGVAGKSRFVYDGLYIVEGHETARSKECKIRFEFTLERLPGQVQPELHKIVYASN